MASVELAAAAEEPAGQSVTYAAQLVTVTSVVTSTVDVPHEPWLPYWPGGPQPPGAARTEVKRAAATIEYFIFADLLFSFKKVGWRVMR